LILATTQVGLLDDDIDSLVGGGLVSSGVLITKGNDLPFSPSWTLSVMAAYDFQLPNGATLTLRGDYSAKDDYYFESRTTFLAFQMGFGQPIRPRTVSAFFTYGL